MKKFSTYLIAIAILFAIQSNITFAQESPFSDFSIDHPDYEAIMSLFDLGIIQGYPDGTLKPDQNINRAELLKIIAEGMGYSPHPLEYSRCFTDVGIISEWYIGYVCFGSAEGWVVGYPDGTFRPENNINNAEVLSMIFKAYEIAIPEAAEGEEWYAPYVQFATDNQIIEEDFDPAAIITRLEAFKILEKTLRLGGDDGIRTHE